MALMQRLKRLVFSIDGAFRFIELGNNDTDVISTPCYLDTLIGPIEPSDEKEDEDYVKLYVYHFAKLSRLVGSLNGFLCFVVSPYFIGRFRDILLLYEKVFVINPLTRESLKFPLIRGIESELSRERYGFGSTVDGDYYKIVRLAEYGYYEEPMLEFKIITVGLDDEWRVFHDPALSDVFHSGGVFNPDGVFLNGVLHWLVSKSYLSFIYMFDVGKEIGHLIPCPSNYGREGCLGVLDGYLCFTEYDVYGEKYDMWTMRQYGDKESWTKDIIVSSLNLSPLLHRAVIPRTVSKKGDILLSVVSYEGHISFISIDPVPKNCVKIDEVYDDIVNDVKYDSLEFTPCFAPLSGVMTSRQSTISD